MPTSTPQDTAFDLVASISAFVLTHPDLDENEVEAMKQAGKVAGRHADERTEG